MRFKSKQMRDIFAWGGEGFLQAARDFDSGIERNNQIFIMAADGHSIKEVCLAFDISKERVRQIIGRHVRKMEREKKRASLPFPDNLPLATRIVNCLKNGNFEEADVRKALTHRSGQKFLLQIPNFSRVSLEKLCDYYGEKVIK